MTQLTKSHEKWQIVELYVIRYINNTYTYVNTNNCANYNKPFY